MFMLSANQVYTALNTFFFAYWMHDPTLYTNQLSIQLGSVLCYNVASLFVVVPTVIFPCLCKVEYDSCY